ncbi:MAG: glycerophosphoryl diester phosphodiesterase [Rhodospirillales bacterium]
MSDVTDWGVPAVIGHRGAAGHAPENTLASLETAAALGVRWVEFDVKLTRDSACVLFHDDTLGRTTDGKGKLADTTLAALRALDAGSWFGPAFAGERVPTLADAMVALARLGLGANVEIKPDPGRAAETGAAVARTLQAAWPRSLPAPLVSSFKPAALRAVRAQAPGLALALNVLRFPRRWPQRLERLGCGAIHCLERELTLRRVRAFRSHGVAVRAFTVNDPARAEVLYRWGVAGVVSDHPERMLGGQAQTASVRQ